MFRLLSTGLGVKPIPDDRSENRMRGWNAFIEILTITHKKEQTVVICSEFP